jgi:hypothetical protein
MSVLLDDFETTVVETKSRGYVHIDTRWSIDSKWETMVFKCNANGTVTDWIHPLDVRHYDTKEAAQTGHDEIIEKWESE